jgi:class 3 adenylate cyclase
MRMGLNTGLVVVGKNGDDLRMDYTAVGDTTYLTARLQEIAQPGSIAISMATHQRAPHALVIIGLIGTNSLMCICAQVNMCDCSLVYKITDIPANPSAFTLVHLCTCSLTHKFTPSHRRCVMACTKRPAGGL